MLNNVNDYQNYLFITVYLAIVEMHPKHQHNSACAGTADC